MFSGAQQGQQQGGDGGELDPAAAAQELLSAGPSLLIEVFGELEDLLSEKGIALADLVREVSQGRSKGQQDQQQQEEEPQGIGPGESDVPMNAPAPAPGTRQRLSLR